MADSNETKDASEQVLPVPVLLVVPPATIRLIRWFNYTYPLRCFYCGARLASALGVEKNPELFRLFTWDHYLPQALGGKRKDNLVPCCLECNSEKADRLAEEWLAARKQKALERLQAGEGEREWTKGLGEFWATVARKEHASRRRQAGPLRPMCKAAEKWMDKRARKQEGKE